VAAALSHSHNEVGVSLDVVNWHVLEVCDGVVLGRHAQCRNRDVWNVFVTTVPAPELVHGLVVEDLHADQLVKVHGTGGLCRFLNEVSLRVQSLDFVPLFSPELAQPVQDILVIDSSHLMLQVDSSCDNIEGARHGDSSTEIADIIAVFMRAQVAKHVIGAQGEAKQIQVNFIAKNFFCFLDGLLKHSVSCEVNHLQVRLISVEGAKRVQYAHVVSLVRGYTRQLLDVPFLAVTRHSWYDQNYSRLTAICDLRRLSCRMRFHRIGTSPNHIICYHALNVARVACLVVSLILEIGCNGNADSMQNSKRLMDVEPGGLVRANN